MAMPLSLLYKIQITTRQKLGLAAVFGVAIIIILAAMIRAIEITTKSRTDAALLALCSIIESTVGVFVFLCFPRKYSPTLTLTFRPIIHIIP